MGNPNLLPYETIVRATNEEPLSGCRSFNTTFTYVFVLFFVANIYDLIVLDWGIFCHSRKLRISGASYRNAGRVQAYHQT